MRYRTFSRAWAFRPFRERCAAAKFEPAHCTFLLSILDAANDAAADAELAAAVATSTTAIEDASGRVLAYLLRTWRASRRPVPIASTDKYRQAR